MLLSMGILREELANSVSITAASDSKQLHALSLGGAALFSNTPFAEDTVYVVEARRLPVRWKAPSRVSLIVAGPVRGDYFENADVEYICVEETRLSVVLNTVLDVFKKYRAFDERLKQLLLHSSAPDAVCSYIADFLGAPFIVFDSALRLQYVSPDADGLLEWETDAFSGLRILPTDFITQLNLALFETSEEFVNDAVLLCDDRLPYNMICTLTGKNNYIIAVFETGKKLTRSLRGIIGYLKEYILVTFESNLQKRPLSGGLTSFIVSMLDGTKFSATDLENQLNSVGWSPTDSYCCIVMQALKEKRTSKYIESFCLKIENQFGACVAFSYKDAAVAIINLDKSNCSVYNIPNRIGILLRDGLLKAGISFKYWNFETTPIYYQQACNAYEFGKLYNPTRWCYIFEDYALYYFMHYGSSRIPPRHLCHPALVQLYRYDQKNGTELLRTLETYVSNNCNAVTAANVLFIHRNTFYQRLNRIQELLKLDLENENVRLYLQISTCLIGMYYYELENEYNFPHE